MRCALTCCLLVQCCTRLLIRIRYSVLRCRVTRSPPLRHALRALRGDALPDLVRARQRQLAPVLERLAHVSTRGRTRGHHHPYAVRRVARFENVRALNVLVNAHAACPRATNVSRAGTNVSRAHQRRTGACVVYVWGETEATRVYFSVRSPSVDVGCRLTVT